MSRRVVRSMVLVAAWLVAPAAARAGCACIDWVSLPQALNLCPRINNSGCDNSPLLPAPLDAMNGWNAFLGHWTRLAPSRQDLAPADGVNSVGRLARATIQQRWGVAVPAQVLALTTVPVTRFPGPPPGFCPLPPAQFYACQPVDPAAGRDVDVVAVAEQPYTVDDEEAFTGFNTPQRKYALRQVMIHEIGHAMGLQHEQATAAVMNPTYLPYRNVPMLADDVGTLRAYRPAIATALDDPMIGGFAWLPGVTYVGATAAPAQVQAGTGVVQITALSVFNRSPQPRPAGPIHLRFGDVHALDLQCPAIPAHGACMLGNRADVPVAWDLSGRQTLYAEIDPVPGEAMPADNVVKLGTIDIVAAPDQDQDGDGFRPAQGDCDDLDPTVNPGQAEDCDGQDQNCDRRVDEGPAEGEPLTRACYTGPVDTRGIGRCHDGGEVCVAGRWAGACVDERGPEAGFCDGDDHDCDGLADLCLPEDAALPDAAVVDAVVPDAAVVDAVVPDAAVVDAVVVDALVLDAVVIDAVVADAVVADAVVVDAAVIDAAVVLHPDAATTVADAAHMLLPDAAPILLPDAAAAPADAAPLPDGSPMSPPDLAHADADAETETETDAEPGEPDTGASSPDLERLARGAGCACDVRADAPASPFALLLVLRWIRRSRRRSRAKRPGRASGHHRIVKDPRASARVGNQCRDFSRQCACTQASEDSD